MDLQRITSKIDAALDDETQNGRLAATVRDVFSSQGLPIREEAVQDVVTFVQEYIRHVPYYIEKGMAAARPLGLTRQMDQMMSELAAYWLAEEDLIPDHLGLVGLMDDAYASLLLLQSVSEFCAASAGVPLLADDLTAANTSIRKLIGEPFASQIDAQVGVTVAQSLMQDMLNQISQGVMNFGGPVLGPDTSWGGYTLDRYVDVQLGAMGVV